MTCIQRRFTAKYLACPAPVGGGLELKNQLLEMIDHGSLA